MPRPATGVTPVRNLRVKNEVWEPALERAQGDGTTITNVITRFLERYNVMTPAERRIAAGLEEPSTAQAAPEPSAAGPLDVPPDRYTKLRPEVVSQILKAIKGTHPSWHQEARDLLADAPPLLVDYLEIERAHLAGILDDLGFTLP